MNTEAIKSMMNPVRIKIIREITLKGKATTREIQEICPDIPQASLYRHIQTLLNNNILKVISENKVRGIQEKVYAIMENPTQEFNQHPELVSKEELSQLFTLFMVSLLSDVETYLDRIPHFSLAESRIGFQSISAYLSDQELLELMKELYASITKRANNACTPERTLRKISTVTTSSVKE